MGETLAAWFWNIIGIYLAAGVIFAVPFVTLWAGRLDTVALKGGWGFRLVILPAATALWPLLLAKTLRMLRGEYRLPDSEEIATASRLRGLHGWAFFILVATAPVLCIAALLSRPPETSATVGQLKVTPLAQVLPLAATRLGDLPIEVTLRTDGTHHQVQLDIGQPLAKPAVALYWGPQSHDSGISPEAVFLGSVWGPARLLFPLPDESRKSPGVLTVIVLSGDQHVLATLPLTRK